MKKGDWCISFDLNPNVLFILLTHLILSYYGTTSFLENVYSKLYYLYITIFKYLFKYINRLTK